MAMERACIDAQILRAIGQNPYSVHDGSEEGYSYLGASGVCIEVLNENDELNLYIDIDHDEYTVSFDVFHEHLPVGDNQALQEVLDLIDGILHNRICAVSVWCPDSNGQMIWKASTCASADQAAGSSWADLFDLSSPGKRQFPIDISATGGEERIWFWDASLCKTIPIPKEAKQRSEWQIKFR